MTKDGRPSLINDIRLFTGDRHSYLGGLEEAVAFGRRIAWFLNGEGFCMGAFPTLYILFTTAIKPGAVQMMNDGGEWWHRYVQVGVTEDFPNVPDGLEFAIRGIVNALIAIRPDQSCTIQRAEAIVREHGDQLRFLLKRRETSKLVVEISSNIGVWPKSSYLFIAHIHKATNTYSEANPITLGFYHEGFDLRDGIRLQDAISLTEMSQRPAMSGLIKRRA
jgi:hypothetical protein